MVLGTIGVVLGTIGVVLGTIGVVLGTIGVVLGTIGVVLGTIGVVYRYDVASRRRNRYYRYSCGGHLRHIVRACLYEY